MQQLWCLSELSRFQTVSVSIFYVLTSLVIKVNLPWSNLRSRRSFCDWEVTSPIHPENRQGKLKFQLLWVALLCNREVTGVSLRMNPEKERKRKSLEKSDCCWIFLWDKVSWANRSTWIINSHLVSFTQLESIFDDSVRDLLCTFSWRQKYRM